jgi:rhomboid protease GluP
VTLGHGRGTEKGALAAPCYGLAVVQPPRPPDIRPPPERAAVAAGATPEQRRFAKALRGSMRREWVTVALVAANAAVFVLMSAQGVDFLAPSGRVLVDWGANWGPETLGDHDWWRLFSSMFVHAGVLHVGFNMYVLWMGGRLVERLYGHAGYLILYTFAGLVGSVASVLTHPSGSSVGASGAVFGVFGALLAFLLRRRALLPMLALKRLRGTAIAFVVLNVAFGFAVPGIDQAAHLGGLGGGFVAGLLLAPSFVDSSLRRPWAAYPVVLAAGGGLVAWIATW